MASTPASKQATQPPKSGRNLIVCCDGTSNEIGVNISNVLKLYRMLEKNDRQRVFYDPGVGTIGQLAGWGRLEQKLKEFFGLATGYGIDDNILRAFRWLCANYEEGDRIFLFGFSRGAYTVRAVAGLLNMIGLLTPDQANLTDYALTAYKRAAEQHDLPIAWQFQRISAARDVTIHFVGVWDTVASVIVPRPDRLYLPSFQFLPYTKQNARVRIFRQASAIDERRAMFRLYRWNEGQFFEAERFHKAEDTPQDTKQVWFAGVHADVGGGYPESESGLSKFPLIWMVEEAQAAGVLIDEPMFKHLAWGEPNPGARETYVPPSAVAKLHTSLKGLWWLLELVPKKAKWLRWPSKRTFAGYYLPLGEPRAIPTNAEVHPSVFERLKEVPGYTPVNLGSRMTSNH